MRTVLVWLALGSVPAVAEPLRPSPFTVTAGLGVAMSDFPSDDYRSYGEDRSFTSGPALRLDVAYHVHPNLAIGVHLAVTSVVAAIAPITGGEVLTWALARWPNPLAVHHACFLVQPVLALLGCVLLLRVEEPRASPLTMVFGAMRNIRTLSGVFGLSFLVNYIFYRANKDGK